MRRLLLFAFGILVLAACQQEPKLPKTPEEVIRRYQAYYDKNQFDEAKQLSTLRERQRLDSFKELLEGEPADSTIYTTTFLSMSCKVNLDTARCSCEVKDVEEPYTTEFKLVRIKGQWLMDAPEEQVEREEDFMELDSLEMDAFLKKDTLKE
jgi:hypothetical protein